MGVQINQQSDRRLLCCDQMLTIEHVVGHAACLAMEEWLSQFADWDLCALLAYDPERLGIKLIGAPVARRIRGNVSDEEHIRRWLVRCEDLLGYPIRAVFAQEHHRMGWPHWHGVIATGGILEGDIATMEEEWLAEHGYAWIERPRGRVGGESGSYHPAGLVTSSPLTVSEYCAKYICKREGSLFLHGFDRGALETSFRRTLGDLIWSQVSIEDAGEEAVDGAGAWEQIDTQSSRKEMEIEEKHFPYQ